MGDIWILNVYLDMWYDHCLGLSESDSKLYTNFEFYEEKIHIHLEKHIDL